MGEVEINWLAVLVASVVGFAVGGLWYGPLFGDAWMRSLGWDPVEVKARPKKSMRQLFTVVFLLNWGMAMCMAGFVGNGKGLLLGAVYGFLTGLPFVGFALAVNALFEGKKLSYILINGAYWTVTFTLMGLIIGWWQ